MGQSKDIEVQRRCSSGGLISSLLIFALEEGIIDGAIVTKMNEKNPLDPEVFIATTKQEVLSATKSKYCPVPVNLGLRKILKENGKFAVVGLPCQIAALRKAELKDRALLEKVKLHVGLICNHSPTFSATHFLLQKMKIECSKVEKLEYRSEGWPGGLSVYLKDKSKRFVSLNDPLYWGHVFNYYFWPRRCFLCIDKVCELSDLSFGDAWLPELNSSQMGHSIVISRSAVGQALLENALLKDRICLSRLDSKKVIESQALDKVKGRLAARFFISKLLLKKVPIYNQKMLKSNKTDYAKAAYVYYASYISRHEKLWRLISVDPFMLKHKFNQTRKKNSGN
jgi:coenzyme F420 hydrogenase subunit beta